MSFLLFIRELTKYLIAPLPLLWLLLICAFIFYWLGRRRISRWFLGSALLWFLLISTPILPKILLARLEQKYQPVQLSSEKEFHSQVKYATVHILVLGSGYTFDDRLSFCSQLNLFGLARLTEGIRLQRLIPNSKIVFSGYAGDQSIPQAEISALAAQELGVDREVILTICETRNTRSEAIEYFKRFGAIYRLYLVTDASHMQRAVMLFRNAGLHPIPVPTNFIIRKNKISHSYLNYLPQTQNISFMDIATREYLGMLWAQMGGN